MSIIERVKNKARAEWAQVAGSVEDPFQGLPDELRVEIEDADPTICDADTFRGLLNMTMDYPKTQYFLAGILQHRQTIAAVTGRPM